MLRDALSKRDRLEQLDRMSDKFDDKELSGMSIKEKVKLGTHELRAQARTFCEVLKKVVTAGGTFDHSAEQ